MSSTLSGARGANVVLRAVPFGEGLITFEDTRADHCGEEDSK